MPRLSPSSSNPSEIFQSTLDSLQSSLASLSAETSAIQQAGLPCSSSPPPAPSSGRAPTSDKPESASASASTRTHLPPSVTTNEIEHRLSIIENELDVLDSRRQTAISRYEATISARLNSLTGAQPSREDPTSLQHVIRAIDKHIPTPETARRILSVTTPSAGAGTGRRGRPPLGSGGGGGRNKKKKNSSPVKRQQRKAAGAEGVGTTGVIPMVKLRRSSVAEGAHKMFEGQGGEEDGKEKQKQKVETEAGKEPQKQVRVRLTFGQQDR